MIYNLTLVITYNDTNIFKLAVAMENDKFKDKPYAQGHTNAQWLLNN